MKKLVYGTFLAVLAAFMLFAGTPNALAQGWSWDGGLSGGWSVSQPSSGSSGWYGSTPGWGWSSSPSTGSRGSWSSGPTTGGSWSSSPGTGGSWSWWSPVTPSPSYPGGGTPAPAPAPNPEPPPPGGGSASEEQYLINAANAERAAAGKAPLAVHSTLTSIARTKARDMAVNGYFDHVSPSYGSPRDMMLNAGLNPKWWGENIGRGSSVEQLHQAFMESPDHRANILSAGYTHMGAGVVRQGGRVYVAEEFMKPR